MDQSPTLPASSAPPPLTPPRVSDWRESERVADIRLRRRAGAVVFVAAAALLAVATYLQPSATGMETHRQLNLPPCGWVTGFGIPCPTCGMTTAFAAAADGDFIASIRAQPLGFLLALATAASVAVSAYVVVTGSAIGGHFLRMVTPRFGWWMLVALVLAWLYKVAAVKFGF